MTRDKLSNALVAAIVVAAVASAAPARAGIEQTQIRSVANLTRLAFGCALSTDPDNAIEGPWTLGPPPLNQLTTGSPNQRLLARAWYYGWSRRDALATTQQKDEARKYLQDSIDAQYRNVPGMGGPWGHYSDGGSTRDEALTSSHFQLWAAAMTGAYVFAIAPPPGMGTITAGSPTAATTDIVIRDSARRWWADEKRVWDWMARANSSGVLEIDAPGARFTSGPFGPNPLRDDLYRLLRDKAPNQTHGCTFHRSVTSSFAMKKMRDVGISLASLLATPLPGETATGRYYDTLCIYTVDNDNWAIYFPKMREALNPMFWVQKLGGVKSYEAGHFGSFSKPVLPSTKPRNLPTATVRTIAGQVPGASSCPSGSQLETFTPP